MGHDTSYSILLWWRLIHKTGIHAERHLRRIVCVTDEQHRLVDVQRQLVWWFYASSTRTTPQPPAERR